MTRPVSIIPGSTVAGRFALVRHLGQGSMGSVWLARHLALDIDVAIKFIDSSLTKELNYVERFQREARAAAQLKSPHVVQVLDYGTDQHGRPFMAMEYLEGTTLGNLLESQQRLDLETTTRVIAHAARGLAKAHHAGIVHRDIKPENLFLCMTGENDEDGFILKVLDFGVARAGLATNGHGTLAGQLVGSPVYMSPEQARGYRTIDHRADLFSLAVVAYQCLTGMLPFNGDGLGEVLLSICSTEPRPPSQIYRDIPPTADAWFEKALSKKPQGRFDSARAMSLALADALGVHMSSGVDVQASHSRVALSDSGSSRTVIQPSDVEMTQVTVPQGSSVTRHATAHASSRVQPTSIAEAVTPLAGVPHVRGVALLDHNDACLLVRGEARDPASYTAMVQHARTVGETVESIDGASGPSHLCVRFDTATIFVRWMGPFTLIAWGDAEMRPLLVSVGSNRLAERLAAFLHQLGAVDPVANMLRDSGIGIPVPEPRPSATTGPRRSPTMPRTPAALRATGTGSEPGATALTDSQAKKARVIVYRGQVTSGPKLPEEQKAKKKVLVYRGRVIDEE